MKRLLWLTFPVWLLGCATQQHEALVPTIVGPDAGWSVDAANWISYKQSSFGPRLNVHFSNFARSPSDSTVRLQVLWINSYKQPFLLQLKTVFLEYNGRRYEARGNGCHGSEMSPEDISVFVVPAHNVQVPKCLVVSFELAERDYPDQFYLSITGLHKSDTKISVPRFRFKKMFKSVGGSFA